MAKQIRSKEVVASILEDNTEYYDLIESKPANKIKPDTTKNTEADAKILKENDLMKRRNEHLLQILLEFENENKLLEKGLVEIDDQIKKLNTSSLTSSKRKSEKEAIIKCPSLEKLLNVCFQNYFYKVLKQATFFIKFLIFDENDNSVKTS